MADGIPVMEEDLALKTAFDKAAGPEYMRYAYMPVYRLARKLVHFALEPMSSNADVDDADDVLADWEMIRRRPSDCERDPQSETQS